ncbi:MAG: hypothetical protein FJX72_04845 [Armatimonadetes bacterium]|nr:hypothetical protein [Armatimonadota bacterium]
MGSFALLAAAAPPRPREPYLGSTVEATTAVSRTTIGSAYVFGCLGLTVEAAQATTVPNRAAWRPLEVREKLLDLIVQAVRANPGLDQVDIADAIGVGFKLATELIAEAVSEQRIRAVPWPDDED